MHPIQPQGHIATVIAQMKHFGIADIKASVAVPAAECVRARNASRSSLDEASLRTRATEVPSIT
jgi:hypothetical protein